jgi:Arc/MetJ family transcription regulator
VIFQSSYGAIRPGNAQNKFVCEFVEDEQRLVGREACPSAVLRCVQFSSSIHILVKAMRTNIVIDDALMKRAMRASGAKTKREAVERSLELMVRLAEQERLIRSARGKLRWEGDLKGMRRDRFAGE